MGKVVQIRVIAQTWLEDVAKAWPSLTALAWKDLDTVQPHARSIQGFIQALGDEQRFGAWQPELKELLETGITELNDLSAQLDAALSDWNAQKANAVSLAIEEVATAMEKSIPKEIAKELRR
ncbi:MAG: hypothetical protein AB7E47_00295 [Desulfovibrionaceae bacterium]